MFEMVKEISASTLYLILGLFGALFFIFRIAMMFLGMDDGDVDGDVDVDIDGDIDPDLELLSLQGLAGAMMIFGFTGFTLTQGTSFHAAISLVISLLAGLFTLWLVARLYIFVRSLGSSGNANLNTACGQEASVYLTIPPRGTGKIQVKLSGSLKVLDARTEENEAIPTGNRVLVKYVADDNIMVVSPVRSEFEQL